MYTFTNQIYSYEVDNVELSGSLISIVFDEPLITNRQYTTTILKGLSGIYNESVYKLQTTQSYWFTSRYCPIFSTLGKVKLVGGPILDSFLDDTIYRMIHKNSLDAIDLFNVSTGSTISYDYWGCSWHDVPITLRRYVECKTAYDLLALSKMSGKYPEQLKTLGDLTIKYASSDNTSKQADPSLVKELYDCWKESLRMFRSIKVAVKGYYDVSKNFAHPIRDTYHNRIIKPVTPFEGNFTPGTTYWRGI